MCPDTSPVVIRNNVPAVTRITMNIRRFIFSWTTGIVPKYYPPSTTTNAQVTLHDSIEEKPAVIHGSDTGKERCKCPYYGNKPCNKECRPPVFFIKPLRTVDVFFFNKGWKPFQKDMEPDVISNPVIYHVPQTCSDEYRKEKPLKVHDTVRCRCTAHEKEGIIRKKWHYDKTGL